MYLEEFDSLSLKGLRGQRGERRLESVPTEAQGGVSPHLAFWERTTEGAKEK